ASHERDEFAGFLAQPEGEYLLVVSSDGEVVACGGYFVDAAKRAAALCWNMVHPAHHRRGIGQWLLMERLSRIREQRWVDVVLLDTSQHSAGFYLRCGFVVDGEQIDGYAAGLHRIEMNQRMPLP
ncbi:MAG TPA: GNAT family N-acetyltransferase, partial [Arenimonas sp.]|nr:GNAT family N-acetyltransferase [Arenimonas sp.]